MNHELLFFFQSVLWGALLLFFYDVLRIGRRLFPREAVYVSMEDLAYWSLAGVFLFGRMYQANEGKIRGYAIAAVILGMVFYSRTISGKFVSVTVKILRIPLKFLISIEKRLLFVVRHCKILILKKLRRGKRRINLRGRFTKRRGKIFEKKSGDKTQKAE